MSQAAAGHVQEVLSIVLANARVGRKKVQPWLENQLHPPFSGCPMSPMRPLSIALMLCCHGLRRHPFSRVLAKNVYNEYINDRHHIHMNATKWLTLTEFVKYLGREGEWCWALLSLAFTTCCVGMHNEGGEGLPPAACRNQELLRGAYLVPLAPENKNDRDSGVH